MRVRDVPPSIKRFFPWSLFLAVAALLLLAGWYRAHAEEDVWACYASQRYQAMSSAWPACNEMSTLCVRVRQYLNSHTIEEGRAEAAKLNAPAWLVRRAERCIPK